MCGIVGVVSLNCVDKYVGSLKYSLSVLGHRGPDHCSIYNSNNLAIGYVRLSIRGMGEKYNQPISYLDNVAYANGEIYSDNGKAPSTKSNDLLVLIKSVVDKGIKTYECIDGDFAAVIWNPNKQKLVLCRDYFGVKPLYYSWIDSETLVFASEIKGIKPFLSNLKISNESINEYLILGYTTGNNTPYENIKMLEPATILTWNLKDKTVKVDQAPHINLHYTSQQYSINKIIKRSTETRLVSDVTIGAHLSGGYDSTLISLCSGDRIKYYSAYNSTKDFDYMCSLKTSRDLNLIQEFVELPPQYDYYRLTKILDSPIMSPGAFVPYYIAKQAASDGVRVMLEGQGADELFLGYSRLATFDYSRRASLELVSNSNCQLLNKLFTNNTLDYTINELENALYNPQEFYIYSFMQGLLKIEDATNMHFSIENRVPYLSLDVRNTIEDFGVCVSGRFIKYPLYKSLRQFNYNVHSLRKHNMNRPLKYELDMMHDIEEQFMNKKLFKDFNYKLFELCYDSRAKLSHKEQYALWAILCLFVWFETCI